MANYTLIFFHCELKCGRDTSFPPPEPNVLVMALGRFFIKSPGQVIVMTHSCCSK